MWPSTMPGWRGKCLTMAASDARVRPVAPPALSQICTPAQMRKFELSYCINK